MSSAQFFGFTRRDPRTHRQFFIMAPISTERDLHKHKLILWLSMSWSSLTLSLALSIHLSHTHTVWCINHKGIKIIVSAISRPVYDWNKHDIKMNWMIFSRFHFFAKKVSCSKILSHRRFFSWIKTFQWYFLFHCLALLKLTRSFCPFSVPALKVYFNLKWSNKSQSPRDWALVHWSQVPHDIAMNYFHNQVFFHI